MQKEKGGGLLQVIFFGVVVSIFSYTGTSLMTKPDKNKLRLVRRKQKITMQHKIITNYIKQLKIVYKVSL